MFVLFCLSMFDGILSGSEVYALSPDLPVGSAGSQLFPGTCQQSASAADLRRLPAG